MGSMRTQEVRTFPDDEDLLASRGFVLSSGGSWCRKQQHGMIPKGLVALFLLRSDEKARWRRIGRFRSCVPRPR